MKGDQKAAVQQRIKFMNGGGSTRKDARPTATETLALILKQSVSGGIGKVRIRGAFGPRTPQDGFFCFPRGTILPHSFLRLETRIKSGCVAF